MSPFANDNEASPDGELLRLLDYLDRTAILLRAFGCYAAVSQDGSTIYVCPILASGLPELVRDNSRHLAWSQVTCPDWRFAEAVIASFSSALSLTSSSRR